MPVTSRQGKARPACLIKNTKLEINKPRRISVSGRTNWRTKSNVFSVLKRLENTPLPERQRSWKDGWKCCGLIDDWRTMKAPSDWRSGWLTDWSVESGDDGWMGVWMGGWMCGWMDVWRDEWMDGWMDGWKDGWMDDGSKKVWKRPRPMTFFVYPSETWFTLEWTR